MTQYFVSLLHRLGYRSRLREFPSWSDYLAGLDGARSPAQIGIMAWGSNIAVPSDFTSLFRCPATGNVSRFCDRRIEDRINEADAAQGAERDASWQRVYRLLSDAAPAVPLVNRRTLTLVSKRVGNYQHHPLWGPLYDQMWVR
jgi:ABC-type transport system substrate-binding protein